ncbi:MAG: ion channel [Planctomycetales bacterium]
MSTSRFFPKQMGKYNMLSLLIALLLMLMIVPIFEHYFFDRIIMNTSLTIILVFGVVGSSRTPFLFPFGAITATIAIAISWTTMLINVPWLFVVNCVLQSMFFATMAGFILHRVLTRHLATFQSLFGAVCVYLLLGLAWAMLYWGLERIDSESLSFERQITVDLDNTEGEVTAFSQLVYFSFVTMSTLGYGDIYPETPIAQTLTWMQSVTGQFYLAILVARLMSALPQYRQENQPTLES